jgi:hypothetical protein
VTILRYQTYVAATKVLITLDRDCGSEVSCRKLASPEKAKAGAVPSDDSFWFDHQEDSGPAGPKAAEGRPEESIQLVSDRTRSFAFKHRDLPSEGEDFESRVTPTAKDDSER